MQELRGRLSLHPDIESLSFSLGAPTSENNFNSNFFLSEKEGSEMYNASIKPVDRFYLETYGLKLIAGRWFTESDELRAANEGQYVYVVNETAARKLGFHDPLEIVGKYITTGVDRSRGEVIGVTADFHVSDLHQEIDPVVLVNFPFFYYTAGVRVNSDRLPETIAFLEKHWTAVFPDYYFEYAFMDEELARLYRQEERTFLLFKLFSGMAIFIGCLGLYGLVSFMTRQRQKEVGIRKVLGASVTGIVTLFSREFVKLVVIAFFIAAPLSWYLMDQWLQGFAYRISIRWPVFVMGIASTLIIALVIVGYRSVRAAMANPVDTLRNE